MLGINYPKEEQINHKVINAFDLPSYKMTPHFEEAFHFIDSALKQGNLLVHCAAGISRVLFQAHSRLLSCWST
jgi:protein-tyrosine phosphatase